MVLLLCRVVPLLTVVTCVVASLSWADQMSSLLRVGHEEAETSPRTIGPFHSVNFKTFYDFFSSRFTVQRFIMINVSQYIFITIGWIITATMWSLIKGDDLSKISIDVPAIADFLVDPQKGFANIGIGVGSALFAVGGWTLLSSLGSGSSRSLTPARVARVDKTERLANPELLTESLYAPVDATFGWQGIAKQTAINTVLMVSFVSFWLFCSWLPLSDTARTSRRSFHSSQDGGGGGGTWNKQQQQQQHVIDTIAEANHIYV